LRIVSWIDWLDARQEYSLFLMYSDSCLHLLASVSCRLVSGRKLPAKSFRVINAIFPSKNEHTLNSLLIIKTRSKNMLNREEGKGNQKTPVTLRNPVCARQVCEKPGKRCGYFFNIL
jgi:hypothetical protein